MVKGLSISAHQLRKMGGYQDLHKKWLKTILISFEMNLGENSCLYQENRVAENYCS